MTNGENPWFESRQAHSKNKANMAETLEKICGLICAYNEQKSIARVIYGSKKYLNHIIVVDDGSTDRTAMIASQVGAILLHHKKNLGKGAALKTGFRYFLKENYDAIITLDADGQHLPGEIPLLINKLKEGYDVIIGKRDFRSKNVPFTRKAGNLIDSYILSKLTGEDIYDAQNGFRAFRREVLLKLYNSILINNFPYEAELVIKLIKNNFKIGWVDITTIYSKKLESKIKPFKHTCQSLRIYNRCFWDNVKQGLKNLKIIGSS